MSQYEGANNTLAAALDVRRMVRGVVETEEQRWRRFYAAKSGPLMAWLLDEAAQRELTVAQLAAELKVTISYLAQLHCGLRRAEGIGRGFAAACGTFLCVPAVVVMVVAGQLRLVDLVTASDFERWVADEYVPVGEVELASGVRLNEEVIRMLPLIVGELRTAAAIHERRTSGL